MDDKEKKLNSLRNEMENVRELYLKGMIDKKTYQDETAYIWNLSWSSVIGFNFGSQNKKNEFRTQRC